MVENIYDSTSGIVDTESLNRFTAIVVTYNEAQYLSACLDSLLFCDEIIVIDLGSSDNSVGIANEYDAKVLHHPRVPVVEKVRSYGVPYATNEWIVFADPDEVFPKSLIYAVNDLVVSDPDIAAVSVPYRYFFRGKPLYYNRWGGEKYITRFFDKKRMILSKDVHRGVKVSTGHIAKVPFEERYAVRHYWADSYKQLLEKHRRYIHQEGESRYNAGQRFSWSVMLKNSTTEFVRCLVSKGGWRGGWTGWFLSFFWGWYILSSWLALKRYQERQVGGQDVPA